MQSVAYSDHGTHASGFEKADGHYIRQPIFPSSRPALSDELVREEQLGHA